MTLVDVLASPYTLPVIAALIALVTIVITIVARQKDEKRITWGLIALWTASAVLLVALCVAQAVQNVRSRNTNAKVANALDTIGARCGDMSLAQQLLEAQHRINVNASPDDAKEWASAILEKGAPQIEQRERAAREAGVQMAGQYKLKWYPVFDYVVTQFDKRVAALDGGKFTIIPDAKNWELVSELSGRRNFPLARSCQVGRGGMVGLSITEALVRGGQLVEHARLVVSSRTHGADKGVFHLVPIETGLLVEGIHPEEFGELPRHVSADDAPRDDLKIQAAVTSGLTAAFESAVAEAIRGEIYSAQ